MILKLLLCTVPLAFNLGHVAATSCYELHQSQLNALNERMNQMIDTISTLLPKSLKKLTSPVPTTPAPSVDYIPSSTGHETRYYISPPAYTTPIPTPHIVYVPPSYVPGSTAVAAAPPIYPNTMSTPLPHYIQAETGPQPEYYFSTFPQFPPRSNYQYEQLPQYPTPMTHLTPPLLPPGPVSFIQSPIPAEYPQPYLFNSPSSAPIYPNIPGYAPSLSLFPLPVQVPPGAYVPSYPQLSEVPQKYP